MANQFGIHMGEVLRDAEAIKGARQKRQTNAFNLQQVKTQQNRNALSQGYRQQMLSGTDEQKQTAAEQYATIDPEGFSQFTDAWAKADDRKRKLMQQEVDFFGNAASMVLDNPKLYARARADFGEHMQDWPEQWNPEAQQRTVMALARSEGFADHMERHQGGTASIQDFGQRDKLISAVDNAQTEKQKARAQGDLDAFERRAGFNRATEEEKTDQSIRKDREKTSLKRIQGFIDTGVDSADSLRGLRRAKELAEVLKTGGLHNAILAGKEWLGLSGNEDESELKQRLSMNVLQMLKPIFGGAFTAEEGRRLQDIMASFSRSSGTNVRLLEDAIAINERSVRRAIRAAEDQQSSFEANEIKLAAPWLFENETPVETQERNASIKPTNSAPPNFEGFKMLGVVR